MVTAFMSESRDEDKRVIGLQYEAGKGLPRVILKGSGKLAEKILERSKEKDGPPVVKDKKLMQQLYRLPIDAEIGPELYEVVAVLLVHVFAIEEQLRGSESE